MRWLLLLLLVPATANAGVQVGGHLKGFFQGMFPYEHLIMPEDPTGSATLNARLVFEARPVDGLLLEIHPQLNARIGASQTGLSTGVGGSAPELIPMTVDATEGEDFRLTFRVDRASMSWTRGPVRFTAGRQPMTFGQGSFFTPLDLVAPFTPTTLDTSYKPGVDALRADVFIGMSGRITALAAYLGEFGLEGSAFVITGGGTIGLVDLSGFVGAIHGDGVFGVSVNAPIGPLGVYGDLALTVDDEDVDFRGVVGLLSMPSPTTSLSIEVYGQTFGSMDAVDYLVINTGERFQRGELWLAGHLYAAVMLGQEISPLWRVDVAIIGNLMDPSVLLSPTVSWSIAENADVAFGAQIGLGERPGEVELTDLFVDGVPLQGDDLLRAMNVESEFGLLPVVVYARGGFHF